MDNSISFDTHNAIMNLNILLEESLKNPVPGCKKVKDDIGYRASISFAVKVLENTNKSYSMNELLQY